MIFHRIAFALLLLSSLSTAQNPTDGVDYFQKMNQASQLLKQKNWSNAETILKQLTKNYPVDGTAWGQLAVALRNQKKYSEAIPAYEKVMEIQGPGLPYRARYWIAASQAALGKTNEALDTLQKLVFVDAYLERPDLFDDPNFASLKNNSRFRSIAGKEDASRLNRIDGWRYDIDYFVGELKRNNPAGAPIPDEFWRRERELKAAVPKLNDYEIVMGLGRMIHVLGRGHTSLWLGLPGAKVDFKAMPVHLYIFPEGLFITEGRNGHEDLAGAEVIQFGKTPAAEALKRMESAMSAESGMEVSWIAPFFIKMGGVLKGLDITEEADRAELTLKMPDGKTVVKTLNVIEMSEPDFKLNPPPHVETPLFLRSVKKNHWLEPLPKQQAIYAQINNIMADDDETMAQYGLRVRKEIDQLKPRYIIVDLRHNNGGDTFTYVELLRTLTAFSTVDGNQVYVLIGRNVYSAAANFVADLERVVHPIFVGEPTAATGNQWGDESPYRLPYSGIAGSFAGTRWQLSHPWDKRRSIVPQVPVQLTAKDYFAGKDPVLDAVFRLIDQANPH